jgi:TRAP transporter 4TM/12TM fusion protein
MEKYEEQKHGVSGQKEHQGIARWVVTGLSIALTLLMYYTAFWGTFPPIIQRGGYMMFVLPLIFMLFPAKKKSHLTSIPWYDLVLTVVSGIPFLWVIYSHERVINRMYGSDPVLLVDLIMGIVAILVILEATRRTMGNVLNYIALFFIAYALFGSHMPGLFAHKGVSLDLLVEHNYLVPEGIFNMIMGVQATFLFTFLSFSAILVISGADQLFLDFATGIAGKAYGGPAKISCISSMLFGSISGSTVANVVVDGCITIPLMKKCGFKPHEAAAIETAASTGGAIMPPVMGAGIFLMAEFTGVPLATIIKVSFLPAFLYYGSIFFYVHIKAKKNGLKGIPGAVAKPLWTTILRGFHLFIPVVVLVYLIYEGYTPFLASAACTVLIIPVGALRKETRLTWKKFVSFLEISTRVSLVISAISASGALIMGLMTITGLIEKVQSVILSCAGGSLLVGILLIALMSYVLGMPLPVTTTYIIIAMLGAPALVALMKMSPIVAGRGLPPEWLLLLAHMVCFWFAQDATITPPVCMTAFAAAAIGKADYMRTGWESMWVAKALYIMPFLLVYSGILLWNRPVEMLFDFMAAFFGFALMPTVMEGYFLRRISIVERIVLAIATILFLISTFSFGFWGFLWLISGGVVVGAEVLYQKMTPQAVVKSA